MNPPTSSNTRLLELILQFIEVKSWEQSRRIVKDHQSLLLDPDNKLNLVFDILVQQAGEDNDIVSMLELHRNLLNRCREIGIPVAFLEVQLRQSPPEQRLPLLLNAFITADTNVAARQILEAYPKDLLGYEAGMVFDMLIEKTRQSEKPWLVPMQQRRHLLRRCQTIGVDAAFAELN